MAESGVFLHGLRRWGGRLRFASIATAAALSPTSYAGPARAVVVRQIYFTAWQILPWYLLFATLLSGTIMIIVIAVMRRYGLTQYALELLLRVLVLEVIPLLTVLFVALRSGAAIGTEIALMRVSGEIAEREAAGANLLRLEYVPRVAAAALSVFSLTVLSCVAAMLLAYVVMYGPSPWGFDAYTRIVGQVFGMPTLIGTALKCLLFGIAVAVMPISAGLEAAPDQAKSAPVAVLGGMVRLFFLLGLIEVLALAAKYL
jgi:phospholipid/cholesterol/gamma-HCH transport system permease protein